MSVLLLLAFAAVAAACLVVVALALCRISALADARDAEHEHERILARLSALRSPEGRRFFAHTAARRELVEVLMGDADPLQR